MAGPLACDRRLSHPHGITSDEEVVRQSQVPLFLTSRRRPSWITARQILYGEVVEIGRSALAMTPEEAALVLEANNAQTLPGLVSIAEGWPAVIGLAALVDPKGSLPEGEFAEELH